MPFPETATHRRVATYLERSGHGDDCRVTPLHGDASNRVYMRVTRGRASLFVLAVHPAPFDPATLRQLAVGATLTRLSIPVPAVLDHAGDLGILALEDLGNDTLQDWMRAPGRDPAKLYRDAIDIIARMQRSGVAPAGTSPPPFDTTFDVATLSRELAYFRSEFLGAYRQIALDGATGTALDDEFVAIAEELAGEPRVLCHRDFHSRNLMVRNEELVVIDFQDARMGPATYDLVSLLRDCYVDLDPSLVAELTTRFLDAVPAARASDFARRFDLMSVQRHLKALGTFGHQIAVADRPEFASSLPRTFGYLRSTLGSYPRFGRLLALLTPHVPELTP